MTRLLPSVEQVLGCDINSADEFAEMISTWGADPYRTYKGYMARCMHPDHDDPGPSMEFFDGDTDLLQVRCYGACQTGDLESEDKGRWLREVMDAARYGKEFEESTKPRTGGGSRRGAGSVGKVVARYEYWDAEGTLTAVRVRLEPKGFRWEAAETGGKVPPLGEAPLFRLPQLLAADPGVPVYVTEGEKDCERAAELGVVATCSASGRPPTDTEALRGRHVRVVIDRDETGRRNGMAWRDGLEGIARSVTLLAPIPDHKGADLTDHLDAGHSIEDLVPVTADTDDAAEDGEPGPWANLSWLQSGVPPTTQPPTIMRRDDGVCLFYEGKVNGVFGDPETGKSWLAYAAGVEALHQGQALCIVDADHNGAPAIVSRLLALGAPRGVLADLARFRIAEPEDAQDLRHIVDALLGWEAGGVIVLDSVGELMPMFGASSESNDEVTTFGRMVPKPLARAGWCVITVDHLPKAGESRTSGFAIGGQAKKRAIDGTYLSVTVLSHFAPGRVGTAVVRIEKDRHGQLRRHSPDREAGVFALDATDPEDVRWSITSPNPNEGKHRPTTLMEKASRWVSQQPGEVSMTGITTAIGGKKQNAMRAVECLTEEGYLTKRSAQRGSRTESYYSHERSYERSQDPKLTPNRSTVPHRSTPFRNGANADRSTVPPPIGGTVRAGEKKRPQTVPPTTPTLTSHLPPQVARTSCVECGQAAKAFHDRDGQSVPLCAEHSDAPSQRRTA